MDWRQASSPPLNQERKGTEKKNWARSRGPPNDERDADISAKDIRWYRCCAADRSPPNLFCSSPIWRGSTAIAAAAAARRLLREVGSRAGPRHSSGDSDGDRLRRWQMRES